MSAVDFILKPDSVAILSVVLYGKIVMILARGEQKVNKTNDAFKILKAMTHDDPEMEEMIRESYVAAQHLSPEAAQALLEELPPHVRTGIILHAKNIDYPVELVLEMAIAGFLDSECLTFADCKPPHLRDRSEG
jgi:hypothetical protein